MHTHKELKTLTANGTIEFYCSHLNVLSECVISAQDDMQMQSSPTATERFWDRSPQGSFFRPSWENDYGKSRLVI